MDDLRVDDLRVANRAAVDLAVAHLTGIREHPVYAVVRDEDREWLSGQELPDSPRPAADLVEDIRTRVLTYPMGNGHPRFFGWVNSPPNPAGVLVAPLAAALNPSTAGGDHAGVLLEHTVVRWLADLVGFPYTLGGGLLTSGTSMATIVALSAARQWAARADGWDVRVDGLSGDRPPLVAYVSEEGHSCLRKAYELLGLGSKYLRVVPVDSGYRLDVAALRTAIEADLRAGLRPFWIAASAGTVNTGAVDPLDAVADVAASYRLWFHVDGAYGAFGAVAPILAPHYAGLSRADSLALDPHKWLGVPVDCGCVLVRDPATARDAFSLVPAYLRDDGDTGPGWFSEYGPEQTRPFRALKVWSTMSYLGRSGIVALVERTAALARELAGMVEAAGDLEPLAPVTTSITAFRWNPGGLSTERLDAVNQAIPVAVQRRGRAFITGTHLGGREALRACFLSPDTTSEDLAILLGEVRTAAASL